MKIVLQVTFPLAVAVIAGTAQGRGDCGGAGGWVTLINETSSRLVASASLGSNDVEEKDYAWGDLDKDGDIDLVCVRKQPFTSTGRKVNVLFMNEGVAEGHAIDGVLVDRTDEYATDADDGGNGFDDETNDRDVVLADVNGDTWLDIVTCTTLADGLPKTISHPRVYINKGEIAGVWQGFRYEQARIPQLFTHPAGDPVAPRFCSVAAGDVTGDGRPDLYFGDYDSSGAGGAGQPAGLDLNNRLLINNGSGTFADESQLRMGSMFNYPDVGSRDYLFSAFGAASVIADMNNDGVNDVVKQTSLSAPTHVAVVYNNMNNEGFFNNYVIYNNLSPYFVTVGDLNSDGWNDMVITDDGTDRYLLNQGNGGTPGAAVTFTSRLFENSDGFGSQSVIADLDNDGHNDVLISDVDVDIGGCDRFAHIYRNLGNVPNVSFQEDTTVIPQSMRGGTYNIAVFDLNGDGWKDVIMGRCNSTEVWINQPPVGLVTSYPNGQPAFIPPNAAFQFEVDFQLVSGGTLIEGSGAIHVSVDGGPFVESAMQHIGGDNYLATLPATVCPQIINYYFSVGLSGGGSAFEPCDAPAGAYTATAAGGTFIQLRDEIEGDVSGWIVQNDPSLSTGAWQQADPVGTVGTGGFAAPDDDATSGAANVMAFVTQNGKPGGSIGAADVDGGPTHLISPVIDLDGTDAIVTFARWHYADQGDQMLTAVSNNNGSSWVTIPALTTTSTGNAWQVASFQVGEYVTPTANVRVRFTAHDTSPPSIVEAGIDNFQIEAYDCTVVLTGACCFLNGSCTDELEGDCVSAGGAFQGGGAACAPSPCGTPCPADILPPGGDGQVSIADINSILSAYNQPCNGCPQDIMPPGGDGQVSIADVNAVLAAFGPCVP